MSICPFWCRVGDVAGFLLTYQEAKHKLFRCRTSALVALLALAWGALLAHAANYEIDPAHTSIHFRVGHFQFSKVQGRFNRISGNFSFDPDNPGASNVHVVVDVSLIDTNHEQRDVHMREPENFNIA